MEFEKLSLHDCPITSIAYEWKSKVVTVIGEKYNLATKQTEKFTLEFLGVTYLSIPHNEEWGPSECILETLLVVSSEFQIQMQSGDLISISAECFTFN